MNMEAVRSGSSSSLTTDHCPLTTAERSGARNRYARRDGVPDAAIRSALELLYRARDQSGGAEPRNEDCYAAAGLRSSRVLHIRDRMRAEGALPPLRRAREHRPHVGHRPRPAKVPTPPAYPLEPTVREHRAREGRLGIGRGSPWD